MTTSSTSRPRLTRGPDRPRFPGALLLLFPLLSLALLIAWLQHRRGDLADFPTPPEAERPLDVATWTGSARAAGGFRVEVRLTRLHPEPAWQAFETRSLRRRFGRETGEPWQLELNRTEEGSGELVLSGLALRSAGSSLQALVRAGELEAPQAMDPVLVLFSVPCSLGPDEELRCVLWGTRPSDSAQLVLGDLRIDLQVEQQPHRAGPLASRGVRTTEPGETREEQQPAAAPGDEGTRAAWAAEREQLELENLRLTGELQHALAERIAREEEFLSFTTLMSSIVPPEAPAEVLALLGTAAPAPQAAPEPTPAVLLREQRSKKMARELRAMLVTESIDSLVLLDAGLLGEGFIGPLVFRQLDSRGRPIGSISADRLRLEGSRAGRTLTIVLEDGYERRDGGRFPFEGSVAGVERGGVRRIFLQSTDPDPWFDVLPELFGEGMRDRLQDDGRWEGFLVHRKLNELLGRDAALGYYRMSALGGVLDGQLRAVELEQLDPSGRLLKRLLADRLTISIEPRGVLLLLEDGIHLQGAHKSAFLGGRYRIFLPAAVQADWRAAGLPGLVDSKHSALATGH